VLLRNVGDDDAVRPMVFNPVFRAKGLVDGTNALVLPTLKTANRAALGTFILVYESDVKTAVGCKGLIMRLN
jgi:hypothetical protein